MKKLEDAIQLILETGKELKTEKVDLSEALGRVLAENIYSDIDMPSFDKSAVDGFAIQSDSLFNEWQLLEFIPAGKKPKKTIGVNQCSRIMTGGMIPKGANMVVMLEHTEELPKGKIRFTKDHSKSNILHQGEDLKKGTQVLSKGIPLKPAHIGILAGAGITNPKVFIPLKVGIISTGTELVEPNLMPQPPFIRNTNAYHIQALCKSLGMLATNHGILEDQPDIITQKIKSLLMQNDMVIFTGGASFGDHDFSKQVMENLGADIKFNKLAIQPGKPVLFAKVNEQYLFGLSGNPVSSSVQFLLLIKPLVEHLTHQKTEHNFLKLPMEIPRSRNKSERDLFFPVEITKEAKIRPLEYHGSAHLNAYEKADALACFPIGKKELREGEIVDVRPI